MFASHKGYDDLPICIDSSEASLIGDAISTKFRA